MADKKPKKEKKKSEKELKQEETVSKAYRDVLGRDPDAGGLEHYKRELAKHGEDWVRADIASSKEARERGVDARDFGAKDYDPATLPDKVKPFYDEWRSANPGSVFTDRDALQLKWEEDAGSLERYQQVLAGNIVNHSQVFENGEFLEYQEITPAAVEALGKNLGAHFTGTQAGMGFMFPEDAQFKGDNFSKAERPKGLDGYKFTTATGNMSSGLFGDVTGWDNPIGDLHKWGLPEEVTAAVATYLDVVTSGLADLGMDVVFGSRGGSQIDEAQAELLHTDKWERVTELSQRVVVSAAEAAISIGSGGTLVPAAMAIEAGYQGLKARQTSLYGGKFDWGSAAVQIGSAGVNVGSGFVANVAKAAATNAASQWASRSGNHKVDWGEVAQAALVEGIARGSSIAKLPGSNVFGANVYSTAYSLSRAKTSDERWDALAGAAVQMGQTLGTSLAGGATWEEISKAAWENLQGTESPLLHPSREKGESWWAGVKREFGPTQFDPNTGEVVGGRMAALNPMRRESVQDAKAGFNPATGRYERTFGSGALRGVEVTPEKATPMEQAYLDAGLGHRKVFVSRNDLARASREAGIGTWDYVAQASGALGRMTFGFGKGWKTNFRYATQYDNLQGPGYEKILERARQWGTGYYEGMDQRGGRVTGEGPISVVW